MDFDLNLVFYLQYHESSLWYVLYAGYISHATIDLCLIEEQRLWLPGIT